MSSTDPFLAPEVLLEHLQTITILESMFPSEITLPSSFSVLSDLVPILESNNPVLPPSTPLPADFRLILSLDIGSSPPRLLELEMVLPLRRSFDSLTSSPRPPSRIVLKLPTYLSRSQYAELCTSPLLELPPEAPIEDEFIDRLLLLVDHLRETIPTLISENESQRVHRESSSQESEFNQKELDRVWFWLPSLSTKEKRNDIVRMAPSWNLTGFVLAGKPGILCLEGNSKAIDSYMGWIKSVSWSDIPAFQKITERHRTPLITHRLFQDMVEITDLIEHRGYHGNRGEMGQVRTWIEDRGGMIEQQGSWGWHQAQHDDRAGVQMTDEL
ncbi:Uncharacterised conserved protein UCP038021, RWD [Phaffia rhodozyma]|uniref:Uncharacterized conserved protein UCP038021, RWD n=1 Tax=Phaffia rhodozyma TaxID=264483 RepID=A0A0F7SHJ2_PHARH|nr:Uncharacterised conserved protein UCP038021, RWD [Phaffia rhodozyma]